VVREAFIRAWPRWQALTPKPSGLDAWVYGQVRDRYWEVVRAALGPKHDVDRDVAWPEGPSSPLAEYLIDSNTGLNTALSRAELGKVLHAALEKLKPLDREILSMYYLDVLDYEQIGAILGLKANTASVRAIRALKKLRQLIPPDFRPPGASRP
jgi:RNA polymerase sigma factor (sigma-70 family)